MNNVVFKRLLEFIIEENEAFETLINADNPLGINVTSEEVKNYLEFTNESHILKSPLIGNIIITDGDILSILKIIHDALYIEGEYIIYINENNMGTIAYLISRANLVFQELNINITLKIDFSKNYNTYLNSLVTILGSEDFVNTASKDFANANCITV